MTDVYIKSTSFPMTFSSKFDPTGLRPWISAANIENNGKILSLKTTKTDTLYTCLKQVSSQAWISNYILHYTQNEVMPGFLALNTLYAENHLSLDKVFVAIGHDTLVIFTGLLYWCPILTHWPKFKLSGFQVHFSDWWLGHLSWNFFQVNVFGLHWWWVNIFSGNIRLGALRQQAITWANVDPDLCRHMASLVHNELKSSHCISFEDWDTLDFIYTYLIFLNSSRPSDAYLWFR